MAVKIQGDYFSFNFFTPIGINSPLGWIVPLAQGSIVGLTLLPLYINDLPDDVICNIAIYADDTTLYSKCDQNI